LTSLAITGLVLGVESSLLGGFTVAIYCLSGRGYEDRILEGDAGDFLGATICVTKLTLYFVFACCTMTWRDSGQIRIFRLNEEDVE
jgi:hypothetical protein